MSKLNAPQRRLVLRLFLAAVIVLSLVTAFLLRFEYAIPRVEIPHLLGGLAMALGVKLAVFYFSRSERGGWRYSGIADLYQLLRANLISSAAFTLVAIAVYGWAFPRSVYCIDFLLCFLAMAGARVGVRMYHESMAGGASAAPTRNVLIYGAGSAGMALLREIRSNPAIGWQVRGLLDDD